MEIILSLWLSRELVEKFSCLLVERLILQLKPCLPLVDLTDGISIKKINYFTLYNFLCQMYSVYECET